MPQDEDADDTYDNGEKYCNDNSDEEAETNADEWPVENSPPLLQMQRGSNEGVRTRGNLGFKHLTRGCRAADDGEEKLGEITGEGFVKQLSQLPPNPLHGSDNMGYEDGGALSGNTKDIDKPIASQEILGVEKYHDVINDPRCDSNQTIEEQKIELDEINDRESARFPAASEEFPQLPVFISQEKAGSPAPDETSCTNSSPSSPRLQFEVVGEPGETDKEDGGSDEEKESNGFTSDGKKPPCEPILERRKFEFHGVEEQQQRCHAVDKAFPQAPSLCRQSKLRVLEPGSPISPRPDEISPLTTPSGSSLNLNPNEGSFVQWEEGDLAEGDEDETPPYPAKTIQNLIATEHVKIVYLEDLEALHGFLEAMMFSRTVSTRNSPLLAIWGLVGAHYQTNYFGGEGIGETVARAVETAAKSGRLLVLGEGYILVDYGNGEDEMQEQCWVDLEVPILNMGSMVVGRTVEVRQILRRWCRFGEDLEGEEDEEETEEERERKNEDDDGDDDGDGDE